MFRKVWQSIGVLQWETLFRHKFNLDKDIIITHNNDILLLNPRRDVTEKKGARVNSEQFYSFLQQWYPRINGY